MEPITPARATKSRRERTCKIGGALRLALLSTLIPGSGHLVLRHRIGYFILGAFLLLTGAGVLVVLRMPRDTLLAYALSSEALRYVIGALGVLSVSWLLVILDTYLLAVPRHRTIGQRLVGGTVVAVLCAAVLTPFGYAAYTANTQRNLLDTVFPDGSDGRVFSGGDVEAIRKPRVNLFLVGSDAGPDRVGARTDTMMVASIDTRTGRTTLFGLPRNLMDAQFPPGSDLAELFPDGFTDPRRPDSPEYLLNALYQYGNEHPDLVPPGPSKIAGLNLLNASVGTMLGLELDYYTQVNMAGFASIIDALGGLDVNVGPLPVPIGGIGPSGEAVEPLGYLPAGRQHLNGDQSLWYARSRTNTDDYTRMGRQRCLLKYIIDQKSPIDVLSNFRDVAEATSGNVTTNIPQAALPGLVQLAMKARNQPLESISFDPTLPNPTTWSGEFNPADPDFPYLRQVVQAAISPPRDAATAPAPATTTTTGPTTTEATNGEAGSTTIQSTAPATSLDTVCHAGQQ